MNKLIIAIVISSSVLLANKTYNLTKEDYIKYKQNPIKMEEEFKNKFVYKKTMKKQKILKAIKKEVKKEKVIVKKDIPKKNKIIAKKKTIIPVVKKESQKQIIKNDKKVTKSTENFAFKSIKKRKKIYTLKEVNNKLKYDKIIKNKNISILNDSIKKLLKDVKNNYEIKDIILVINQIHNKKISSFESEVYLKQIKQIIRDIN